MREACITPNNSKGNVFLENSNPLQDLFRFSIRSIISLGISLACLPVNPEEVRLGFLVSQHCTLSTFPPNESVTRYVLVGSSAVCVSYCKGGTNPAYLSKKRLGRDTSP